MTTSFATLPELRSWYGSSVYGSTCGHAGILPPAAQRLLVQHWLWGDATLGYHLVNILLHGMAAVMVALILRRLSIPGLVLAAAIFALRPVHVESVAWISELKNTPFSCFLPWIGNGLPSF